MKDHRLWGVLLGLWTAGCFFDAIGSPEAGSTTAIDTSSTSAPVDPTTGGSACGDGIQDPGEACDGGPMGNGQCTPSCTFNVCGDGHVGSGEDCDGDIPSCENCELASCGNGAMDPGEECDDGNAEQNDACLSTCKKAFCGDGFIQAGNEECDDGNAVNTDACVGCKKGVCGDGFVEEGNEFCDDGNQTNDDDCPNSCAAPGCGDGVKTAMEECDDDNTSNDDGCSATCKLEKCGDGVKQASEDCDNGETENADDSACTSTCKNAVCGDGLVLAGVEECDDGNKINTDACTDVCETATCGDGITGPNEECDDGNMVETDACVNSCQLNVCGDGKKFSGVEQCDDGNKTDFDACRNNCQNNLCGDGYLNQGVEACDHGALNDDNPAQGACKVDCTRNAFLVFVTSKLYLSKNDFTSIATADMRCAEAAASDQNAFKIKGTRWKAWLSDGISGPGMNFHKSTIPYVTLLGGATTTVADDWTDLSDGTLDAAIDVTDKDVKIGGGADCDAANLVWTGTQDDNTAGTHCMAWTSNMAANTGTAGTVKQTNGAWTDACNISCDKAARLYCVEQPSL